MTETTNDKTGSTMLLFAAACSFIMLVWHSWTLTYGIYYFFQYPTLIGAYSFLCPLLPVGLVLLIIQLKLGRSLLVIFFWVDCAVWLTYSVNGLFNPITESSSILLIITFFFSLFPMFLELFILWILYSPSLRKMLR